MLWINKYHVLIDHTFSSGSSIVDIYHPDFSWSQTMVPVG